MAVWCSTIGGTTYISADHSACIRDCIATVAARRRTRVAPHLAPRRDPRHGMHVVHQRSWRPITIGPEYDSRPRSGLQRPDRGRCSTARWGRYTGRWNAVCSRGLAPVATPERLHSTRRSGVASRRQFSLDRARASEAIRARAARADRGRGRIGAGKLVSGPGVIRSLEPGTQ